MGSLWKKLTADEKDELKRLWISGFKVCEIAKKFNVHPSTVHKHIGTCEKRPQQPIRKHYDAYEKLKINEKILENTEVIIKMLTKLMTVL